jgi:seryl-tRNA synthetase
MAIPIDKETLEKALNKKTDEKPADQTLSREEEIGFHKGSLNTLAAERNELVKMIYNIESIMQAHLKRLEELGVAIQKNGGEKR